MNIATTWHPENGEWSAWIEGNEEEGPYGSGKTEEEAKDNLAYELDMRDQDRLEKAAPALLAALETAVAIAPNAMLEAAWGTQAREAIAQAKGSKR